MLFKRLARSELLSTFFPTWIWQGRQWAKWRIPKYDKYYWLSAYSHPVISTYYAPHAIIGFIGSKISLDGAFNLLVWNMLMHMSFSFFGWYCLVNISTSSNWIALLGAITFTLAGYNWKQQPCFQYTVAWFPWILYGLATHNQWLAGISLGMLLLAGYYPIGLQIIAIAIGAAICWGAHLWFVPIGVLIGLPQIIPFIRYLPKTIRTKKVSGIGKVPWWQFGSLIFPKAYRFSVNGVGYWEMSYYIGLIPLFTLWCTRSMAIWLTMLSILLMLGICGKYLPRIPARFSYAFQFGLIWCAVDGLNRMNLPNTVLVLLCLIQAYDLWKNNSPLLVNHPYAELYNKPSRAFNTRLTRFLEANLGDYRVSGLPYPLFTGHINRLKTLGYSGGMQLKLMAKWRHDDSSDGSGQHDFFKGGGNPDDLKRSRVKYAYTTQRTNWVHTEIKY